MLFFFIYLEKFEIHFIKFSENILQYVNYKKKQT